MRRKLIFTAAVTAVTLLAVAPSAMAQQLVHIGSYDSLVNAWAVAYDQDYLYVADRSLGLVIFDITNPTAPVRVGGYNTPMSAFDVAVMDGIAFVGAGISEPYQGSLYILDVANVQNPVLLGSITSFQWEIIHVAAPEPYTQVAYASDWNDLFVISLWDYSNPTILFQLDVPGGVRDMHALGFDVVMASGLDGLRYCNILDPDPPVIRRCDTPGLAWGVAAPGSFEATVAYVADGDSGIAVIDIRYPEAPWLAARIPTSGEVTAIAEGQNLLYCAIDSSLVDYTALPRYQPIFISSIPVPYRIVDLCAVEYGVAVVGASRLDIYSAGLSFCGYLPGDVNGVPPANGIDVTFAVLFFKGGAAPPNTCPMCPQPHPFYAAGDVNGSCTTNGIDITYFCRMLFGGPQELMYCPTCPPVE
jgi:hypothetical protein